MYIRGYAAKAENENKIACLERHWTKESVICSQGSTPG